MRNLNYGVIGNCRSASLISEEGSIDWLCLPDFDSPSVFAKILDKENGGSLGKPTSSFTTCTFWLVQALHRIGMISEAKTIFENLLTCSNHVGLFSEDIDFTTKRLLGNFPQAYSHLALINTAILFTEEKKGSRFIKP